MRVHGNAGTLSDDAAALLDRLWSEIDGRGAPGPSRERIREVARAVSAASVRAALLPEQLLVAVKLSWMSSARFARAEDRYHSQWVLNELIAACIYEFYRQRAQAAAGVDGATPERAAAAAARAMPARGEHRSPPV